MGTLIPLISMIDADLMKAVLGEVSLTTNNGQLAIGDRWFVKG